MSLGSSCRRIRVMLCGAVVVILALLLMGASPREEDAWIERLTVGRQAGVRLDVTSPHFASAWPGSYLGLGIGTDLHLFGSDLMIHAFPGNVVVDMRGTRLLYLDDETRDICYVITAFIDDQEYLVWEHTIFAELGGGNNWAIELEWERDAALANLLSFGVNSGYRVYRRFVGYDEIGYTCQTCFDDLELIEEFPSNPDETQIIFRDQGHHGDNPEGRQAIGPPGQVFDKDPLGNLSVGLNLGVGTAAPDEGPGNAQFAGSVGIGGRPLEGVSLSIGDSGFGANINLSGATALGRLWELNSTQSGDFDISDQGGLRLEIAGGTGDMLFQVGVPSAPLAAVSHGTFEVWDIALFWPVPRLSIGEDSFFTVGSDGIPAGAGQPAVGPRLGSFAIGDDALPGLQNRLVIDDDVVFSLGHDTILPPEGGAAALSILREFGSLTVSDALEGIDRLEIDPWSGYTSLVVGTRGLAADEVPAGFEGDVAVKIPAIAPALGAFAIEDTNLIPGDDRMRIDEDGTYFHLGNPAIPDPQTPALIAVKQSAGEFVITDETAGFLKPRFKINTDGKVGIGVDPNGGPAGSLEVAHALGVGMAVPPGALPGDAFLAGNLEVAKDIDILGNVTIAGKLKVLGNLDVKGVKFFVQEHPTDPTKEIAYAALEGPEAGTYVRGTACLVNGEAVIELPESFCLVTAEEGLTVQVTLLEACNGLYVAEKSTERIVVRELLDGTSNAQFDYLVQGVRVGYEDYEPIRQAVEHE